MEKSKIQEAVTQFTFSVEKDEALSCLRFLYLTYITKFGKEYPGKKVVDDHLCSLLRVRSLIQTIYGPCSDEEVLFCIDTFTCHDCFEDILESFLDFLIAYSTSDLIDGDKNRIGDVENFYLSLERLLKVIQKSDKVIANTKALKLKMTAA